MMKRIYILILLFLLVLTGCRSYKKVPYLQELREPSGYQQMSLYDARILPKDLLNIIVSAPEEPELAAPFNLSVGVPYTDGTITGTSRYLYSQPVLQQYLVDNEGNIDFPVIGTIRLSGLTKGEAEQLIKDKLKKLFRTPIIVTVRMLNYKISVIGEVANPGVFTIKDEKVSIFEALAMAGDLTIYGMRDNVKLIREDDQGQREVFLINLNDLNIISSPYYYLQQNDVLYVTPNKTKSRNADVSSTTTVWFSIISSLLSMAGLVITITK